MAATPQPPKPNKVTCVICSRQWEEAPAADGTYTACTLCGYVNQRIWRPESVWPDND